MSPVNAALGQELRWGIMTVFDKHHTAVTTSYVAQIYSIHRSNAYKHLQRLCKEGKMVQRGRLYYRTGTEPA